MVSMGRWHFLFIWTQFNGNREADGQVMTSKGLLQMMIMTKFLVILAVSRHEKMRVLILTKCYGWTNFNHADISSETVWIAPC